MEKSVVFAQVQAAQKGVRGLHDVKTHFGIFSVAETCEGLAALKPGVMAIFHLVMKEPPKMNIVPATWDVLKIQPHPTGRQVYSALSFK